MKFAIARTTDAYEHLDRMVYGQALKYTRRYGYELDELLSIANEGFLTACATYDKTRDTSFPTWCYRKVKSNLDDFVRRKVRERFLIQQEEYDLEIVADKWDQFWLFEFMDELSLDGKMVVGLVIRPPPELIWALKVRGKLSSKKYRSGLKEVLRDIGWTSRRIRKTFKEVRSKL